MELFQWLYNTLAINLQKCYALNCVCVCVCVCVRPDYQNNYIECGEDKDIANQSQGKLIIGNKLCQKHISWGLAIMVPQDAHEHLLVQNTILPQSV